MLQEFEKLIEAAGFTGQRYENAYRIARFTDDGIYVCYVVLREENGELLPFTVGVADQKLKKELILFSDRRKILTMDEAENAILAIGEMLANGLISKIIPRD